MSSSEYEFQLQINDTQTMSPTKYLEDTYSQNRFTAFNLGSMSGEANEVMNFQAYLKTQYLMLQHQQKRKNERLKQIQYVYTNAFTNYLLNCRKSSTANLVIVNQSDLLHISDSLIDELQKFQKVLFSLEGLQVIFKNDSKPPLSFLKNFHNFYPQWDLQISKIIHMEIQNSLKIENAFQSQYTFPSKILASLKYSFNIERFCQEMFSKPLQQLTYFNEELSLDFHHVYEGWASRIKTSEKLNELSKFLLQKNASENKITKRLKLQVSILMGIKLNEAQKLVMQMTHFSVNKQAINSLFEEIGFQEMDEQEVNIKLSLLVWKKILSNRKKIESVLTSFIDQILNSFQIFPHEVKFVIRQYYKQCKKKFGEVRYEDIKSFFNKVIYSQLLFPEFMRLLEEQEEVDKNVKNFNIPIIALLSQKILFGQQFYQKAKYSYFNQLITHYQPFIHEFMNNFLQQTYQISTDYERKFVEPALLSFETIKYLYDQMFEAKKIMDLDTIQSKVCTQSEYLIGSSKYKREEVFIILMNKKVQHYHQAFKPKNKLKRILIEFLTIIDKISQPTPLIVLLEQYKFTSDRPDNTLVQLHANYLSLMIEKTDLAKISKQTKQDIEQTKYQCQRVKISLQKQFNFVQNMEKVYMKMLKDKRKQTATKSIHSFIKCILESPTHFNYDIVDEKVCEIQGGKHPTIKKCLQDIALYYTKRVEGYDALYHMLIEKVIQQVQNQGIVDEDTILSAKNQIGKQLYQILKLKTAESESDKKILFQMQKHNFLNLKLLQLQNYLDEEELILQMSLPLLKKIGQPNAPDELLKIFHEVTYVFQNIIITTGRAADITADLQIPMMIFIFVKSKMRNLQSIISFIQSFCSEEINSNILGQTLTLIKSASFLVQSMNGKSLNMDSQKYEELCTIEKQMLEGEADRQYRVSDFYEI